MSCNGNEKIFELGERRRVTMKVWLNDGASFTPTNATFRLLIGSVAEAEGSCELMAEGNAWLLTCEVEPKQRRQYKLQYSFALGTEIIKRSVDIRVV